MNRLFRIAMRISGNSHIANAYGFEKLPGFGAHFRPEEVDNYQIIPEDLREKLKKALYDHESLTAKAVELFRLNVDRGDPVKVFNARKSGLLTDTKALLKEVRSRYPNVDLSKADQLAQNLSKFKLTDDINNKDQYAYDMWMSYHHELLSHLLYIAFNEEARDVKMATRLASIAFRIAFELKKLPTKDDDHVQESDVDIEFETVPIDIRNRTKSALRTHDSLKDWSSDQDFSVEAQGDPVKQFRSKKGGTLREVKNVVDVVKGKYPDINLGPVEDMMGKLAEFQLKYEEEAESYDDLPSAAITAWISYTHNILSHLLYMVEQEEAKKSERS